MAVQDNLRLSENRINPDTCLPTLSLVTDLMAMPAMATLLRVLSVCSQLDMLGPIMAIMQVLVFSPTKESRNTWVSLLARKGRLSLIHI